MRISSAGIPALPETRRAKREGGCAVVAVADAAVTVASTAVSVTATAVETTVDVAAAGVDAVVGDDEDEDE